MPLIWNRRLQCMVFQFFCDPIQREDTDLIRFSTSAVHIRIRLQLRIERLIQRYQRFFLALLCHTDAVVVNISNIRVIICSNILPVADWIRLHISTNHELTHFRNVYGFTLHHFEYFDRMLMMEMAMESSGVNVALPQMVTPDVYYIRFCTSVHMSMFKLP